MDNPIVSIIVPIYNVEKYLDRCVTSLVNQTLKDIEIILVDDGSTDMSSSLCDKWGNMDQRIKVIHKENGGLSDARNVGTEYAIGNFIYYLDSDDFLEENAIEILLEVQRRSKSEIVLSNFYYTYSNHEQKANTIYDSLVSLNNGEAMEALIIGNIETFAWGKLIQSNIAKKYKFPLKKLFEDHYWTHNIFYEATKVSILPEALVHYRQRDDSISYTYDIKRLDMLEGWLCRKNFLTERYPPLVEKYVHTCSSQYINMAWLILTRMKKYKLMGLNKLRKYNTYFSFEKYSEGEYKKLIIALNKNII